MSDFELNNEERLALAEVLSMKSQDSNGDFFGSRDEIQSILESRYSSEINPDRINNICNEILSPMFDGGVSPKYENVKSYMENYEVFMEDSAPVNFNSMPDDVSVNINSEDQDFKDQSKDKDRKLNGEAAPYDKPSKLIDEGALKSKHVSGSNSSSNKEDVNSNNEYERERDRKADVDRRTRESYEAAQELQQNAAKIRRDMATKSFMNPYSLMGYTFAQLSMAFNRVAGNFLASRALAYPLNAVRSVFGMQEKTLSGKKIFGIQASYNAKDPRSFKWEKGENNRYGNMALEISKNIPRYIENGNYPLVNERMHHLFKLFEDETKKPELNLEGKKQLQDNLKKISSMLNTNNENDSRQDKEAKKKLAKLNQDIIKFIAKIFGVKIKGNGPDMPGP